MRNRIRKQSIAPRVLFLKRKRDIVANGSAKVAGAQIVGQDTRHNDPSNTERYYFSMEYTTPSGTTVKTTKIRLWELA